MEAGKIDKKIRRAKKVALKSSLINDLRKEFDEGPEEISEREHDGLAGPSKVRKQRQKYEEDYLNRLPENKRLKHLEKKNRERSGFDSILSFGKYLIPGDDDDEDRPTRPRQKKGHFSKGGKKSNFKPTFQKSSFKGKGGGGKKGGKKSFKKKGKRKGGF